MITAFPGGNQAALGTMFTLQRTGELAQIQNVERNRCCVPAQLTAPIRPCADPIAPGVRNE